jgi:galactokinase
MIRHRLAAGEYNLRRRECEEAVRLLTPHLGPIAALRDVSLEGLQQHRGAIPDTLYRRARHVVSENARVQAAAVLMDHGDLEGMGRLLGESHRSLRDDFEVSCDELDVMVRLAGEVEGVFGARMTGGGFGGCTVNLVRPDRIAKFRTKVAEGYRRATGLNPEIYVCNAADGAGPLPDGTDS